MTPDQEPLTPEALAAVLQRAWERAEQTPGLTDDGRWWHIAACVLAGPPLGTAAPEAAATGQEPTSPEALAADLERLAGEKGAHGAIDEYHAGWHSGCSAGLANAAGRIRHDLVPQWAALGAEAARLRDERDALRRLIAGAQVLIGADPGQVVRIQGQVSRDRIGHEQRRRQVAAYRDLLAENGIPDTTGERVITDLLEDGNDR